jgi:energy-converting hydrogenase B subunit D
MIAVQVASMALVGLLGLAVVVTRNPLSQLMVFSLFGAALSAMFLVLQAPDVALSEIVVGAVAYPFMVLLALGKVRNRER